MTSSVSPQTNPTINAAQTGNAASSSISGTTSPLAAGPAPTARSYANATKKQFSPPPIASDAPPVAVGGPASSAHHAKNSSISPVNGKSLIQPAVPTLGGAPAIVSSNSNAMNGASPAQGEHIRKASTTTFSASGTSGYMPNGAPIGPNGRPKINFGQHGQMGSPAPMQPSVPHYAQSTGSPAPNPRVTVPAKSPSPIQQPGSTSGGKPPAGLQGQGIGLSFGSLGIDGAEPNARPVSMPPVPSPHLQAQHLRRESSQSAHSDMGNPGMNAMNRGYPPNGGRGGRGGFTTGYPPMAHSPAASYRPLANQQRGPPNMPGQFQPGQAPLGAYPNSPMRQPRSPGMTAAAMQQQVHLANNPQMPHVPYGGYPAHFGQQQGIYNVPPQLDPTYAAAYYHPQYMHPGMMANTPNPRGPPFPPHMGQQPYMPGQYGPPQGPVMSRSPSQVSERPPSTLAQPQTPSMPAASHVSHTHTPSQSSSSPAPSGGHFVIPQKKASKAIPIMKPDGSGPIKTDGSGPVSVDKKAASPAPPPAPPKSPVVVVSSSTSTPPPRVPSAAGSQLDHSDGKQDKTADEKKNEFKEQFKSQLEAEQAMAEKKKMKEDEEEARAAKEKAEAEAKAAREREEAELAAAKEKEAAEKAKAEEEAAKAKEEAEKAEQAKREEEERLKREEEERLIAEMEELERQEEERERQYQEKKKRETEERLKREAEAKAREDEELRAAERAAEAAEEAKLKAGTAKEESTEEKAERERLFASLKRSNFGPGANSLAPESGASTPVSDISMPPPSQPVQPKTTQTGKPKPAALKLETTKPVEPAQPTAGMQALKSARFLQVRSEAVNYPEGIKSPNPALNQGGKSRGRQYDKTFLLQFQDVFKEKPSLDWDTRVKETVGDSSDSSRPQSARTPLMGGRQPSRPGLPLGMSGPMGSFNQGGRTLPPGTTSAERFQMASSGGRPTMTNPLATFGASRPGGFPIGGPGQLPRTGSFPTMPGVGANSPRPAGSQRGKGSRRGLDKDPSKRAREEEVAAKSMPLTAGQDLKPLHVSNTGWKPPSVSQTATQPALLPNGHMAPDMVQRKVKAALNKMTPEKFDKIADQILDIAAQSKDEQDGRTLRQVIQLTFEKACDEAHWASMYAKFCKRMLETMSSEIKDLSIKDKNGNPVVGGALFRKYLLNRCQEEFERGWEVNLPQKPEGESGEAVMLSDEYYIAAAAKRRGLGLIQFIGELYKLGMLTLRIMHECVVKLLNFEGIPDESGIESLVKLLKTVGATMDATENGPKMINTYFERIENIMKMEGLPSRMRFMLMDIVDLRRKGWRSKDDAKGPKTIQEIREEAQAAHQAAEMERQRSSRARPPVGRGDARSFSGNMPPPEYPRNQVGMDDLRKLAKAGSSRSTGLGGPSNLGPSSMFGSRSSSGRRPLGPSGLMRGGDDSGNSSRTGTPPVREKDSAPTANVNTFSALAGLDGSGEGPDDVASPPSTASSPSLSKTRPARTKSPAAEGAGKEGESAKGLS